MRFTDSLSFFATVLLLAVLSPAASLPVATVACNSTPTGKICFDVYAGTYMTLGLALPPANSQFRDEMMVFSVRVHSFPLPYGYVGAVPGTFQLQDSDSPADATRASPGPPLQILTFWVDRMKLPRRDSYPPGSETLIAESAIRKPGTNGADTLFPLALTTIKTSPIVSGNSTHAIHIFRCLQCAFMVDIWLQN
ncbi:hypothetical protein C8F01DRAFT_1343062 [Mycena amicta]|nr:hypothetical protein C8F01DRAFT_1343062 [Mycena amicta]